MTHKLTRRHALATLGIGTGAFVLYDTFNSSVASADSGDIDQLPLLITCVFNGGWDTLMCLDPRDHSDSRFNDPSGAVYTGYELVAEEDKEFGEVMNSTPSGLVTPNGSNISFGPAIGTLANHYDELCVIRGIDMGTLTHEVGKRYFLTGKFPRGLAASGSSLGTVWVHNDPESSAIPNMAVDTETYNEGLTPKASGLAVNSYDDLANVLTSLNPSLQPNAAIKQAIAQYQESPRCLDHQLDVGGMSTAYRASWQKALVFGSGSLWQHFNFVKNPAQGSPMAKLYEALNINASSPTNDLKTAKGQAAIAAQSLTNGISQAVSIQLAGGIDTHDEAWSSDHAPAIRTGFNALAGLISYLKETLDSHGKPYWDRTTILCYSDFARTPGINARGGRDHHLSSCCLVAGRGIKGNTVIGATSDSDYSARAVDLETGAPDDANGTHLRPPDVHATILDAAGLSYEHISNQDPAIIKAALT